MFPNFGPSAETKQSWIQATFSLLSIAAFTVLSIQRFCLKRKSTPELLEPREARILHRDHANEEAFIDHSTPR